MAKAKKSRAQEWRVGRAGGPSPDGVPAAQLTLLGWPEDGARAEARRQRRGDEGAAQQPDRAGAGAEAYEEG